MAKGHKKIVGMYCYKGYGCKSRFCEFCCNGDKYEEIEIEDEKMNKYKMAISTIGDALNSMYNNVGEAPPMDEVFDSMYLLRELVGE